MTDVLITGASRGIGLALTREYLDRGARVFAGVRDSDLPPALAELTSDNFIAVPLDVRSQHDIDTAFESISTQTDGLDLLINNAGVLYESSGLAEVDGEAMLDLLKVNTVGPLLVSQRFLPLLRSTGKLVNLTMPTRPLSGLNRTENHAFIASRYALNALTRMIAAEHADSGRVIAAMWPGYLRTDMNRNAAKATPLAEAIPAVADRIDHLGPDDHGACVLPDGTHFPW